MSTFSTEEMSKSQTQVHGIKMTYVDEGSGEPVVFLHGNPTSSYLWRNIIPHVSDGYRALAPELIGMGDSDKLPESGPDRYTFTEHREYLDGWFDAVLPEGKLVLVIHDWGSALGFDWARRHPERVRGICFMEAIVGPVKSWAHWPENAVDIFKALRSPAGEEMILEKNLFVEAILPSAIMREMSDEEMAVYRKPFAKPGEDRRPTLTWPRQIPIEGEPQETYQIVSDYAAWLPRADFPKLFINADPGSIVLDDARKFVRSWSNLSEVTVKGTHFIQEDSPHEIGVALKDWLPKL